MLCVKVGLRAVRTRELSVGVLLWDLALRGRGTGWRSSRPPRGAREDAPSALRADHVGGLSLGENRLLCHERALAVGRIHTRLWHDAPGRHRAEDRGPAVTARGRRRRDGLWVRRSCSSLRQHGRRSRVRLLRRLVVWHHRVRGPTRVLCRRRRIGAHVTGRAWSVWRGGGPRGMRVAAVRVLHDGIVRLKRRQGLWR